MLSRFAASALFRLEQGAYWRAYTVADTAVLVRVSADDPHQTQVLHADLLTPMADTLDKSDLTRQIAASVGADSDLSAFYAFARTDETLWSWVEPLMGLPNFHSASLYEALLFTVIEQHISWTAALKIQERFVRLFGSVLHTAYGDFYALPTPHTLARLSRAELAPLKLTTARLDLLIHIGDLTEQGIFAEWERLPPHHLYTRLLDVKGIGHWTATVAVGRATGQQPLLHDNDVALQAAVNAYLRGQPGRASRADTLAAFAPYGPYATTVANLLMMRWVLDKYHPSLIQP